MSQCTMVDISNNIHVISYMSVHVLLNLLIDLRKRDKMEVFVNYYVKYYYFSPRV